VRLSPECLPDLQLNHRPKEKEPYKLTMFDRLGPQAGTDLRAYAYGLMVFGITTCALVFTIGQGVSRMPWWMILLGVLAAAVAGVLVTAFAMSLSSGVGFAFTRLMVDGATTPYKEQYSYQQALVMQGRLDEALASFEAVIAEKPEAIDPRIKAAELYARDKGNFVRAASLFREVQRIATVTAGEDTYVTNRLVDLLTGPLQDPGRALVELRRLIERYPDTPGAEHARGALAALKSRTQL